MTLVIRNRLDPDNGRQIFIPVPPPPPLQTIATLAELQAALFTAGNYRLLPGTYTANFNATVDNVSIACDPGVFFAPLDPFTSAAWEILADNFSLTGTWRLDVGHNEGILIGDNQATTQAAQPDNVLIDGGTIVSNTDPIDTRRSIRGIGIHGSNVTISHCSIRDFRSAARENQAIWINNTNGPITITDCYLEGGGENILVGGDTMRIANSIPSDIYFARNYCFKPLAWNDGVILVKNIFELKAGKRVIIEDNIFENVWAKGQVGDAILFTVRNQNNNTPWVTIDDVVFRRNVIRGVISGGAFAFNILGKDNNNPSVQMNNVEISNNLWEDAGEGIKISRGVPGMLTVFHNTAPDITGRMIQWNDFSPLTTLTFTNNAAQQGFYGFFSNGFAGGVPSLNVACNAGYDVTGNLFGKTSGFNPVMPSGNTTEAAKLTFSAAPDYDVTGAHAGMDVGWGGPYLLTPPT